MAINQKKFLLRTDYKGIGPWKTVADSLNQIGRVINGTSFIRGGDSTLTQDGIILRGATTSVLTVLWGYLPLGVSINNAAGTISVSAGECRYGGFHDKAVASVADISVVGGTKLAPKVLVLEIDKTTGEGTISTDLWGVMPDDSGALVRVRMASFYVEGGRIKVAGVYKLGDVSI